MPSCPTRLLRDSTTSGQSRLFDEFILPQTQEQCLRERLQECTMQRDIASGRRIHALIMSSGLEFSSTLGDPLIRFFSSFGSLLEASLAFCKVKHPNVFVWHAIISTHALHGQCHRALALCHNMYHEGVQPNRFIFPSVLKSCGSLGYVEQGKLNHVVIVEHAFESDVVVGSSLIDMYVKLVHLDDAQRAFDCLHIRNVVSWAAMIDGHAQHGNGIVALKLYERMCEALIKPDKVIFLCVLKACSKVGAIGEGMLIHNEIVKDELDLDVVLANTLVDMYAKCGNLRGARKLFEKLGNRSVVSWGAMITGYAQNGQGEFVLELYEQMEEGFALNEIILPCVLKACANSGNLVEGKKIHDRMVKYRVNYDVVIGSTLVDMYAKCGSLEEAREVFDKLSIRNVVSWGAMIGGYVQHEQGKLALKFFEKMQQEGVKPDKVIFVHILKACGSIGALKLGRQVHQFILESVFSVDMVIVGALVDMYGKCGSTEEAHKSLGEPFKPNIVLWGALIAGYAQHGDWRLSQQCIESMQREGVELNHTIYTNILSAYSHAGETDEGQSLFKSIAVGKSIIPSVEHFTCMIDLLGSTGQLKEAVHLLETMPATSDSTGWTSLMTACKTYGNVGLGRDCFHQVSKLDPNGAGSVLMSSIYAQAHMQKHFDEVQGAQVSGCSWKKPGIAWIEVNNNVEEFKVGDATHSASPGIYANLKRLSIALKGEGYVPTPEGMSLHTSDMENTLCRHSELDKTFNEQSFLLKV